MAGPALVAALAGVLTHRKREWSERDEEVIDAVEARSWSFEDVQARRTIGGAPTWLHSGHAERRHHQCLGMLVDAYRSGALGVLVSYEEMAALLSISRATWKRWRRELLAAGLMRQLATCSNTSTAGRARDNGRNLYQAGAALLAIAGEGTKENTGGTEAQEAFRRRCAGQARSQARRFRRGQQFDAQREQRDGTPGTPSEANPSELAPLARELPIVGQIVSAETQGPAALEGAARSARLALEGAKLPNPSPPEFHRVTLTPQSTPPSPFGEGVVEGLGASLPQAQALRIGLRPNFLAEPPPADAPNSWTLQDYSAHLLGEAEAPGRAIPVPSGEPPEGPPEPDPVDPYAAKRRARAERIAAELAPRAGDPLAANKNKLWAVLGIGPAGPDTEDPNQGG